MILALLTAIEVFTLSPADKAAALSAAEARVFARYAEEDAARLAERQRRGFLGLGIGSALPPQGFAPLGDVGSQGFVYRPESLGARRYRN